MRKTDQKENNGKNLPHHVKWDYCENGLNGIKNQKEVNEIIEEIMQLLISKKVTVACAKAILTDTISSIEKESLFEKRVINGKIT